MPRNSGGTYSLPAGNPVVTATVISSVWANTTLSDIGTALTDSLARNGDGGMTGQFKAASGAIGAPGISWSAETTSGFYRAAAGDFRFAIAGVDVWFVGAGGTSSTVFLAGNGAVGAPSFSFTSDTDLGWYRVGANILGLGAAQLQVPDGAVGAPIYSFTADPDTGLYRPGANRVDVVTAGASHLAINDAAGVPAIDVQKGVFRVPDGAVGAPSISFSNDTDTGIYRIGADSIGITTAGILRLTISTGITSTLLYYAPAGTAANPSYSFSADVSTGFYRDTASQIGITLAGVTAGQIAQGSFTGTLTGYAAGPTGTVFWQRSGKRIQLWLQNAAITGTSNTAALTMTGLPAAVQPTNQKHAFCLTIDNNVALACIAEVSGGTITFYALRTGTVANRVDTVAAGFTNSGTKGLGIGWVITYVLD